MEFLEEKVIVLRVSRFKKLSIHAYQIYYKANTQASMQYELNSRDYTVFIGGAFEEKFSEKKILKKESHFTFIQLNQT